MSRHQQIGRIVTTILLTLLCASALGHAAAETITGGRTALAGHSESVMLVIFSPDGEVLASGGDDCTIKLWSVATGEELHSISVCSERHHTMYLMAFSLDGKTLISGSSDDTISLWDVATGELLRMFSVLDSRSMALSPDGETLATGDDEGMIRLFSVSTGDEIFGREAHSDGCYELAFNPDSEILASASHDGTIKLWSTATLNEIDTIDTEWIAPMAFSPDGTILSWATDNETIKLWDIAAGQEYETLDSGYMGALAFSPDGHILATGSLIDLSVALWDVEAAERMLDLDGFGDYVSSLAFSPAGDMLALGTFDGTVALWRVPFGTPQKPQIADVSAPEIVVDGTTVELVIKYVDPNQDVMEVYVDPISGPDIAIESAPYVGELVGLSEGQFTVEVTPFGTGLCCARVTLVDESGLETSHDVAFEVREPTPPVITSLTFPRTISAGTTQNGSLRFEDAEADIAEVRFDLLDGDASAIEIEPGWSFDPDVQGETEGTIRFSIRTSEPQAATLRVILIDSATLESDWEDVDFTAE